jgi:hypothetical protein
MKALYSTHKHIRLFIFGVPEGWQAALYDLEKQEWIDRGCSSHGSLREAKARGLERAAQVLGKHLVNVRWH